MNPQEYKKLIGQREARLTHIAKQLGRTQLNSSLPWDAVYDNAKADGEMTAIIVGGQA